MPFVKVEVTQEESEILLLRDEELNRVYQATGGGRLPQLLGIFPLAGTLMRKRMPVFACFVWVIALCLIQGIYIF